MCRRRGQAVAPEIVSSIAARDVPRQASHGSAVRGSERVVGVRSETGSRAQSHVRFPLARPGGAVARRIRGIDERMAAGRRIEPLHVDDDAVIRGSPAYAARITLRRRAAASRPGSRHDRKADGVGERSRPSVELVGPHFVRPRRRRRIRPVDDGRNGDRSERDREAGDSACAQVGGSQRIANAGRRGSLRGTRGSRHGRRSACRNGRRASLRNLRRRAPSRGRNHRASGWSSWRTPAAALRSPVRLVASVPGRRLGNRPGCAGCARRARSPASHCAARPGRARRPSEVGLRCSSACFSADPSATSRRQGWP